METSLDYTDEWASLLSLVKADADVADVPTKVREITLANRSANEVKVKRTKSTTAPTVDEGFRLDAVGTGIWYVTFQDVDLSRSFLKTTVSEGTGEVDISIQP